MHRSAFVRIWQIAVWLILSGALATASIGGVEAQIISPQVVSTPADSVSSALAKKPTKTPTRKPKKTRTPTATATDVSPTRLYETPTPTATATETNVPAPALPPGVYHFNGTVRNITKNVNVAHAARHVQGYTHQAEPS